MLAYLVCHKSKKLTLWPNVIPLGGHTEGTALRSTVLPVRGYPGLHAGGSFSLQADALMRACNPPPFGLGLFESLLLESTN